MNIDITSAAELKHDGFLILKGNVSRLFCPDGVYADSQSPEEDWT